MKQTELVIVLIQFVALSLPAVGIYIQILQNSHSKGVRGGSRRDESYRYVDYHLARGGLLMLICAGIFLTLELILLQPPTIIGGFLGRILILLLSYLALLMIGMSLIFVGGAVFVREATLDERSLLAAISEGVDYTQTIFSNTWYRIWN